MNRIGFLKRALFAVLPIPSALKVEGFTKDDVRLLRYNMPPYLRDGDLFRTVRIRRKLYDLIRRIESQDNYEETPHQDRRHTTHRMRAF